jgi:signal peptidase I
MIPIVTLLLALTGIRISLSSAEKGLPSASVERRVRGIRALGETIEVVIIAICAVFLVIRPFCAQAFYIPSRSMTPTLQVNDRLIVNKLTYRFGLPKRNDVVVFRAPLKATGDPDEGDEKDFVKRVIGLPGDTIEVHGGATYVNGEPLKEVSISEAPDYELAPFVVPRGKIFVLGDNRNHSNDSHRWGALDRDHLIGKAVFIFWPPSRCGVIR